VSYIFFFWYSSRIRPRFVIRIKERMFSVQPFVTFIRLVLESASLSLWPFELEGRVSVSVQVRTPLVQLPPPTSLVIVYAASFSP